MDSRLMKPKASLPKALLLKDYLLDDLSSCSSNGFKSFPRKQCCTTSTVRFLIEMDLKNKQHRPRIPIFNRSPSKSALSALQSVIAAVKRFPFRGASSPEKKKLRQSILPRNFSMKILRKSSFWKRKPNQKEIQRWKSFDQLLKEDCEPSATANDAGSELTALTSCNSSSQVKLNLSEVRNDAVEAVTKGDVSTESTTGSDSSASTHSTKQPEQWSSNEEKEQFSPVSVLDRLFDDDDDEEVSSPFQHELPRTQGTKKKVVEMNIQRFGCLTHLEPVNLAKRFSLLTNSEKESNGSCISKAISDIQEEEDEGKRVEQKALVLLNKMETLPSNDDDLKVMKADKLLLDFFREKIVSQKVQYSMNSFDEELLEEAENWIGGSKPRELYLGWEVPANREVYIKDIEKGGEWKSLHQENTEVSLELENEVFAAMMNELLLDISS